VNRASFCNCLAAEFDIEVTSSGLADETAWRSLDSLTMFEVFVWVEDVIDRPLQPEALDVIRSFEDLFLIVQAVGDVGNP
jgi:acyl carrier protein